jgi:hypothetical protein
MQVLGMVGVVLACLIAPAASAAWTRPAVLVWGDTAGLLDTSARCGDCDA